MPNSKRKSIRSIRRSYKKKRISSKTRSKTRSRTPSPKSPSDKCCMCEKDIKGDFLHPVRCFGEHRNLAHKVCLDCWFKPNGFGTEGVNHACPGCVKGMPLSKKIKYIKQPVPADASIIDLT